ncbi:SAM-dependent methyltransferase [Photobacterium japonica]|uniref:SAM-dependent methyltransferase n=1 Tax=Photobacterium japonica TaxID=2910235 RepID=UPI003D12E7C8
MDDYYCDKRGLAAYFEAMWLDKVRELGIEDTLSSVSKTVPDSYIMSPFYSAASAFILDCCEKAGLTPQTYLEVGPALGRTSYELFTQLPSIHAAWIVEPSSRLLTYYQHLLVKPVHCAFPYIESMKTLGRLAFDTTPFVAACEHVDFHCINQPYTPETLLHPVDLSVCLNVLDQCPSPLTIVQSLKKDTQQHGVVVLSNSYQWQKKHLLDPDEAVDDINVYFEEAAWEKLGETELNYQFRFNERYSKLFCIHLVAYKKR